MLECQMDEGCFFGMTELPPRQHMQTTILNDATRKGPELLDNSSTRVKYIYSFPGEASIECRYQSGGLCAGLTREQGCPINKPDLVKSYI